MGKPGSTDDFELKTSVDDWPCPLEAFKNSGDF